VDHIFISYRREDAADVTGRIHDRLRQHFGEDAIFTDVDKIPLGEDFRTHLDQKMSQCKVLLPVIGRNWLNAKDQQGRLRLQDPGDFVRLEIESALERNIPVIPLLVHGIEMPSAEDLPEPLRTLAFRNATPIRRDPDFHKDMDRLIKGLEQHLQSTGTREDQGAASSRSAPSSDKTDNARVLSDLYTEGLSAFYTENWEKAVDIFTKVAAIDSSHEDTAAKLEEAGRQRRLAQLYEHADSARQKEAWGPAEEYLQEIVALDSGYRDASPKLEEARTKRRLQRLYSEAQQLQRAKEWQAALTVLDRIESVDADYSDPDGIRDAAKQALDAIARDRQLGDWYRQALRLLDASEWTAALQALESIDRVDPAHRETKALLSRVRDELKREEAQRNKAAKRQQQLTKQYEAIETSVSTGEYVRASELIASVEKIDPDYKSLRTLKGRVERALELERQLRTASDHIKSKRWDQAIEVLENINAAGPDYRSARHGSIATMLAAAKAEREGAGLPSPPPLSSVARPEGLPTEARQAKPSALPGPVRKTRPVELPEEVRKTKPGDLPEDISSAEGRARPEPTERSKPTSLPEGFKSHARPEDLPS
jgi:outer membrane protein assembly factor BamD (BamD/ComL family)